ncbi:Methyltransf_11 domain-containing protein [Caenorhabditis elegans]|uniref:Methyltransf_11 domain-containing protein n=1 Tax=Caenorhabditis elegans TaxID=6239 RepID=O01852_CAEEL|nr:Methyltransf_11 domain-containing protein [Caenorhabditis elegans]CCD70400.2 Methyltransf_11 domain-containing protein [Caenorhabditis elegans]|eukprot:NP_491025.3 Uncharacterized protein CELE_F32B5.3 [Caenorhabditis elegans]
MLCPSRVFPLLLIIVFFIMIGVLLKPNVDLAPGWKDLSSHANLADYKVKTHKGYVSMEELNENVFQKFGYEIIRPTYPVPTLKMTHEPTCDNVFSEWKRIFKLPQPDIPVDTIPADRLEEFTLYNYTALGSFYKNDKNSKEGERPRNWDKLSELIKMPRQQLGGLAYGKDGVSMFDAMQAHRLDNMSGVVIGSMQPWVEVSALRSGVSKVLTVEYNNLTIQEEFKNRMSAILPIDFVTNWHQYAGKFDFAASFSSIEHSGLGRYGDPMDPIGDIREMLKIKCVLKPGGLLFIGFPLGTDAIQFNAHRIYGSIRLAMMMYGFEWIDTFSGDSEQPNDLTSERLHAAPLFGLVQNTLVLRKI